MTTTSAGIWRITAWSFFVGQLVFLAGSVGGNNFVGLVGEQVRLVCAIINRSSRAVWIGPNDVSFTSVSARHRILSDGALLLENVQLADAGVYTCHRGANKFVLTLLVVDVWPVIELQRKGLTLPSNSMQETIAVRGDIINILCRTKVAGPKHMHNDTAVRRALLRVLIYHNEQLLTGSQAPCKWNNRGLSFSCLLGSASIVMSGHYSCQAAQLKLGDDIHLRIREPPVVDKVTPLVIHRQPGSTVQLKCSFRGSTPIFVQWLHNSTTIPSSNYRLRVQNGTSTLTLTQLQWRDTGQYSCVARNDVGEASSGMELFVRDDAVYVLQDLLTPTDQPVVNMAVQSDHEDKKPFHREAWFAVSIGAGTILIIVIILAVCVHASRQQAKNIAAGENVEQYQERSTQANQSISTSLAAAPRHGGSANKSRAAKSTTNGKVAQSVDAGSDANHSLSWQSNPLADSKVAFSHSELGNGTAHSPMEIQMLCSSPVKLSIAHFESRAIADVAQNDSSRAAPPDDCKGSLYPPSGQPRQLQQSASVEWAEINLEKDKENESSESIQQHSYEQGYPRRSSEPGTKPKGGNGKRFHSISAARLRPPFLSKSVSVHSPGKSSKQPEESVAMTNELSSALAAVRHKNSEMGLASQRKELSKSLECLTDANDNPNKQVRSVTPPPGCSPLWFKPRPQPRSSTRNALDMRKPQRQNSQADSKTGGYQAPEENNGNAHTPSEAKLDSVVVGCFLPRPTPRSHRRKNKEKEETTPKDESACEEKNGHEEVDAGQCHEPAEDEPYEEVVLKSASSSEKQSGPCSSPYDKPDVRRRSASDAALAKAYAISGPLEDKRTPNRHRLEHHSSVSSSIDKKQMTIVQRSVSSGHEPKNSFVPHPTRQQQGQSVLEQPTQQQAFGSSTHRVQHMYDEPESRERPSKPPRRLDRPSERKDMPRQKSVKEALKPMDDEIDEHLYDEPESWDVPKRVLRFVHDQDIAQESSVPQQEEEIQYTSLHFSPLRAQSSGSSFRKMEPTIYASIDPNGKVRSQRKKAAAYETVNLLQKK